MATINHLRRAGLSVVLCLAVNNSLAQNQSPGELTAGIVGEAPQTQEIETPSDTELSDLFTSAQQALASQDYPTALTVLTALAEQGHLGAEMLLGRLYLRGEGVETNPGEAAKWYQRAAVGNDAEAQNLLGEMFRDAVGVENDDLEATWWFSKAAEQELAAGQRNLGLMISAGRGTTADPATGVQWLQVAAQQGDPIAQFQLGRRLLEGDGIAADPNAGWRWMQDASRQRVSAATDYLQTHKSDLETK